MRINCTIIYLTSIITIVVAVCCFGWIWFAMLPEWMINAGWLGEPHGMTFWSFLYLMFGGTISLFIGLFIDGWFRTIAWDARRRNR